LFNPHDTIAMPSRPRQSRGNRRCVGVYQYPRFGRNDRAPPVRFINTNSTSFPTYQGCQMAGQHSGKSCGNPR
jgi:hypothetical protein